MYMRRKRGLRRALTTIVILLLLAALGRTLYLRWEQPPALAPTTQEPQQAENREEEPDGERVAAGRIQSARKKGVYTLLLAGRDDASGNTDTVLLGRLDTVQHRLDLVSLPRDTLLNLDWQVRKLNAVYAGTANSGGEPSEGLRRELRRLCGFTPDCYAVVDLDVFIEAVDLIGGIDFELPQAMHYDDDAQGLHIHLDAGSHRLSGEEAMGLVRYRSGYLNGDLDRVAVQQRFMDAALGQLLSFGGVPRLPELASLLAAHTDTDLNAANIAWLMRQTLLCDREDIRFHTMPNTPATVSSLSYTLIKPDEWLTMLNDCLNPFAAPITRENLDIVYRDETGYHATSGFLRGADYYWN